LDIDEIFVQETLQINPEWSEQYQLTYPWN